jgi:hypothetical protein
MTTYQPVTSPARNHTQLLPVGRWFGCPSPERDSENDTAEEIGLPDTHYRRSVLKMGGPKELETTVFQVLIDPGPDSMPGDDGQSEICRAIQVYGEGRM